MAVEGWEDTSIGALFEDSTPGFWGDAADGINDIAVLRATNITKDCKLNLSDIVYRKFPEKKAKDKKLKDGDILLERSGGSPSQAVGRVVLFKKNNDDDNFSFSNFMQRLRPNISLATPHFCYYLLAWLYQCGITVGMQKATTGIRNLDYKSYLSFPINLPALQEQKKIAEILESVDDAIAKTEAVIAQTQRVKQGLLQQLLTRGIGHTKFKQTELGEIPESWEINRLEIISDKITKGESPRWQGFEYQDKGVLFVTSENVREGFVDVSSPKFIPSEFGEKLSRSKLKNGDVLVNLVGASIGRAAIWEETCKEANINQAVALIRPIAKKVLSEIILGNFYSDRGQNYFGLSSVDSARPNVSLTNLRDFEIAVPSMKEQEDIVSMLNSPRAAICVNEAKLVSLKNLKKAIMSDLLTGRVRVNVNTKFSHKTEEAA